MSRPYAAKVIPITDGFAVRFTFTDASGRVRNVRRQFKSKSDANSFKITKLAEISKLKPVRDVIRDFSEGYATGHDVQTALANAVGGQSKESAIVTLRQILEELTGGTEAYNIVVEQVSLLTGERASRLGKTFADLAAYYEKHYAIPPVKQNGRTVRGLRGLRTVLYRLNLLREFFASKPLAEFTYGTLEQYRTLRLQAITPRKTPIKPATVNREMALLRRLFNIAVRERWVKSSPFDDGETLISRTDENQRNRVLTQAEEERILTELNHRDREHLKPIFLLALDSGMRKNEILRLEPKDCNFTAHQINVRSENTKTEHPHVTVMTTRVAKLLTNLCDNLPKNQQTLFTLVDFTTAWYSLLKRADVQDFQFKDLRRTFATRLLEAKVPVPAISRLLGHKSLEMTYRYLAITEEGSNEAVAALNARNRNLFQGRQ